MGRSIPKDSASRAYKSELNAILERAKSQSARFKEAARELGCDEDEASFDEKLRRIGKAKPQKAEKAPAQRKER